MPSNPKEDVFEDFASKQEESNWILMQPGPPKQGQEPSKAVPSVPGPSHFVPVVADTTPGARGPVPKIVRPVPGKVAKAIPRGPPPPKKAEPVPKTSGPIPGIEDPVYRTVDFDSGTFKTATAKKRSTSKTATKSLVGKSPQAALASSADSKTVEPISGTSTRPSDLNSSTIGRVNLSSRAISPIPDRAVKDPPFHYSNPIPLESMTDSPKQFGNISAIRGRAGNLAEALYYEPDAMEDPPKPQTAIPDNLPMAVDQSQQSPIPDQENNSPRLEMSRISPGVGTPQMPMVDTLQSSDELDPTKTRPVPDIVPGESEEDAIAAGITDEFSYGINLSDKVAFDFDFLSFSTKHYFLVGCGLQ